MGRAIFFVKEALRALRRNAAPAVAATVTVALTVLLLGVLIPVVSVTNAKTQDVRDQLAIEVFLVTDAPRAKFNTLERRIRRIDHVTDVEFVSQRQAKKNLLERLENPDAFRQLNQSGRSNPLPPSFTVRFDDANNLEAVRRSLVPPGPNGEPRPISPLIDEVKTESQLAKPIREVTSGLQIWLALIALTLLIASLFLVANTIRLSIYARRREVEVMRLVGATNWFVRWPFVIEGLLVGFLGAAFALGILWLGKAIVADRLATNLSFLELESINFVPLLAILLACAMLVAAVGSGITLRRFLRV